MDAVRKPNVETLVKIGNFELTVVAYRAFPKTGKCKLVTIIGHDGI